MITLEWGFSDYSLQPNVSVSVLSISSKIPVFSHVINIRASRGCWQGFSLLFLSGAASFFAENRLNEAFQDASVSAGESEQ